MLPAEDNVLDFSATTSLMPVLSPLLHRTRAGILMLLLVVLPLQSVVQLVAGIHGHRHVHTGTASSEQGSALKSLTQPLRSLLDRLHAGQDPRLGGPKFTWVLSSGAGGELHQHGGVFHRHSHDTADVLEVGDAGDEPAQGGATAFLAWLPDPLTLPVLGTGGAQPASADPDWRDRVVAPPLAPPRG